MLALVLGLAACSAGGKPGESEPFTPPDGEASSSGGSTSSASGGTGATNSDTKPRPAPDAGPAPAGPTGGAGSNGDGPAPDASAPDGSVVPDYDPAVLLDDGVLHIWTLGDSITVGVSGGFRNDIYDMLSDDGYDVDLVGTLYDDSTEIDDKDHEGHVAYTFEKTLDEGDSWLAQIHRPDVILMMVGSNDFAWWTNVQPSDHLATMFKLIDHLVETLPGTAIIVATLPPQSSEIVEDVHRDRTEMVEEFNGYVREQLPEHEAYGTAVFLADVNARIGLEDLYDGIHPTREAHTVVAEVWYDVMKQILPE
jgi:lysophospholipase L1-like esterase